jgi:lipopolysaccharide/colanic/teichoic acid biosynthesis glycosyltransferase
LHRVYQRVTGVVGGALGLLLCGPLMLLTALAIKMESPGPILYRQTRVGLNGKNFEIIKCKRLTKPSFRRPADVMNCGHE